MDSAYGWSALTRPLGGTRKDSTDGAHSNPKGSLSRDQSARPLGRDLISNGKLLHAILHRGILFLHSIHPQAFYVYGSAHKSRESFREIPDLHIGTEAV